jgi:hypothetical protein
LESQREVINSFQSAWSPYIENIPNWYWPYWPSPRTASENYAIAISNFADSAIAATRLANNAVFAGMEAWKNTPQQTRDNMLQFSNMNANFARSFENTTKNNLNRARNRDSQ